MFLKGFIGSYTEYPLPDFGGIGEGIYSFQINTNTGELKKLRTKKVRNPSYLALSRDKQYLYSATELDQLELPTVKAYKINADRSLEFLNEQPVLGGFPCYIVTHEKSVLVACYATGNVIQFSLDNDGSLLSAKRNFMHKGSSINKIRQEGPHAHHIAIHPNSKEIYSCDLGIDMIKAYAYENNKLIPNQRKDCSVKKGNGPRHMIFNNDGSLGYVSNELTGVVSVLKRINGVYEEINCVSSLPTDYKGKPSASAIRLHPNGQYLYVANRGLEAISIYRISDEKLILIEIEYTKGEELREFNITPDGQWLLACHQNSHDIISYRIKKNGTLTEAYRTTEILSPVCIVFLD